MADVQFLTAAEVRDRLGVSKQTITNMLRDGRLPSVRNPLDKREVLIPVSAVEELERQGRKKGAA
jgi:excisionase family DNA binding protein